MKYPDGQEVRLGDTVALEGKQQGIVVCSIDTGEYSDAYPRDQWSYLDTGVLIEFPSYGLIYYKEPEFVLRLVAHTPGLLAVTNRGSAPEVTLQPHGSARQKARDDPRNVGMTTFHEIQDIAEIRRQTDRLEGGLQTLSVRNEMRVVNGIAVRHPIRVFLFDGGLWWAPRPYPPPPKIANRRNNLFGLEGLGSQSNVEVNLPIDKFRRNVQGTIVRCHEDSFLLCHRGRVEHRGRSFSVLNTMADMGVTIIQAVGSAKSLIRVCATEIDALQIREITQFVRGIVQAKNAAN